jgi:probable rRNA maturation factor
MSISIFDNRTVKKPRILKTALTRKLAPLIPWLGMPEGDAEITLADDSAIRDLNKIYRKIDKPTNVLSFPQLEFDSPCKPASGLRAPIEGAPPLLYGEIILSTETIFRDAAEAGARFKDELERMIIHGLLHLFGFDHVSDEDSEIMEQREREALAYLKDIAADQA